MVTQNQIGKNTKSYGRITVQNSYTGATFSITATLKELNTANSLSVAWALDSDITPDFSMSTDGRLTYTGSEAKAFSINYSVTTSTGTRIQVAIYKNGLLQKTCFGQGNSETGIRGGKIQLLTNDYVSLWLCQASSGGSVPIYFGQLSLLQIDD